MNCKRVNVAGSQAASYLQRLLQLKYPGHLAAITLSRMEELLHEHSYAAVDYHQGAVHVLAKHTSKNMSASFKTRSASGFDVFPVFTCRAWKVALPRLLWARSSPDAASLLGEAAGGLCERGGTTRTSSSAASPTSGDQHSSAGGEAATGPREAG